MHTITSSFITIQVITIITSTSETSFSICTCLITVVNALTAFINICIKENHMSVNSEIQLYTSTYFRLWNVSKFLMLNQNSIYTPNTHHYKLFHHYLIDNHHHIHKWNFLQYLYMFENNCLCPQNIHQYLH